VRLDRLSAAWGSLSSSTLVRFLVAGGLGYIVNQTALYFGYERLFAPLQRDTSVLGFPVDPALLVASAVALELSILLRFVLNDQWTFRDRREKALWQRLYQCNVTSLGSPAISFAAVNLLTPLFGISYLIANSIGVLLGVAWNWFCSDRVVWRDHMPAPNLSAAPSPAPPHIE
jgi:putative flippase GtrA